MDSLQFDPERGQTIKVYGSIGATVVQLLQHACASVVIIDLEPNGLLGRHPAAADQFFLVMAGSGQAFADNKSCQLFPQTAVLWHKGEQHETRAGPTGLSAIVVEGENLAKELFPKPQRI